MASYQADFYLGEKRVCSLWTHEADERGLYKEYAEPLFRHGCSKGLSLDYQKAVFSKSLESMLEMKMKQTLTPDEISALVTSYLMVKKFGLFQKQKKAEMEIVIVKDKFGIRRKDAFKTRKKDRSKIIDTNVRHPATASEGEAQEHACQRLTTRTRKRSRKTRRF